MFVVAWILPLLTVGTVLLLTNIFHISPVSFSLSHIIELLPSSDDAPPIPDIELLEFVVLIMLGSIPSTFVLFGEEFGWRGYLQKRLFSESPWKSAIATGLIWGIWHFPINLQGYNYPEYRFYGLLVFPVACIFLSYILGWFYRNTSSIWAPCFSHAAFNGIAASLMVATIINKETYIITSVVGILGIVVLALVSLLMHFFDRRNI
ncbi:CPBP family intramembrane glutamic endopeptidase [Pleionea sediminis]|uniref:CPBP family intramembrane glutamic endopeptidase n=1 Tax=Pleionea sediminis TaxID=2569479 RepID=UPI001187291E|nr:CPBP family intramembrane glutamic endopeptidase [Pleionea sediminis]